MAVAVGQEYEVSVNLSVEDGLMNGSTGVVMKLDYVREESRLNGIPDIVWVDFRDPRIGQKKKQNTEVTTNLKLIRTGFPYLLLDENSATITSVLLEYSYHLDSRRTKRITKAKVNLNQRL